MATDLDRTIAALADPYRRRAIDLLRHRPYRAGELAHELQVTSSAMSKHLRVLRESGLVSETHPNFDARVRIYSLEAAPMSELRRWLDATERGWTQQLSALQQHLERKR